MVLLIISIAIQFLTLSCMSSQDPVAAPVPRRTQNGTTTQRQPVIPSQSGQVIQGQQGQQATQQGQQTDQTTDQTDSALPSLTALNTSLDQESLNMQKASMITGKAFLTVIKEMKPGLTETEVSDMISNIYGKEGADAEEAFPNIVGTGANSTDLHHTPSADTLKDGDLVVIDIGARYSGYCSDFTRTYPANGKFTPRQREVYELVLAAQKAAVEYMKPGGASLDEMTSWVSNYFRNSSVRADGSTMDGFFNHGLSHFVGQNVHESGDSSSPVRVGDVFTIEPGLYIQSENIGIRIEDTFIMTDNGPRRLVEGIPSDPDEIERSM